MKTLKLADVVPTTEAPQITGLSLDAFRAQIKRDRNAPEAFKIGHANFYKRADLARWARERRTK